MSGPIASSVWRQNVSYRQAEGRSDSGAHFDDTTNPIEIRLPGRNCFTVVLCTEGSEEHTPFFAFLDDIPLDLIHGAAIVTLMNKPTGE